MRKTVVAIAIALATGFSANAQEFIKNEVDDFTGVKKKITKIYTVAKGNGYDLDLSAVYLKGKNSETLGMFVRTNADLGCAGTMDEYIMFKFTDGTTLKYKGYRDIKCNDDARSIFTIKSEDFKGKTVEKIRLNRSEFYNDYTVNGKYTIAELINAVLK